MLRLRIPIRLIEPNGHATFLLASRSRRFQLMRLRSCSVPGSRRRDINTCKNRCTSACRLSTSTRLLATPSAIVRPKVRLTCRFVDDDCMSFPDLLVRVRRHASFTMRWRDEQWTEQKLRIEGRITRTSKPRMFGPSLAYAARYFDHPVLVNS
jgi:hypothetical protein